MTFKNRIFIFLLSFMVGLLGLHFLGTFLLYLVSVFTGIYVIFGTKGGKKDV
jgi:hypothetical protein